MKTTLVNHGGIIQDKFLIKTKDDVLEYQKISARQNGEHMLDFSGKPNRIKEAMISLAEINGDSMLITAVKMTDAKTMAIMKQVSDDKVVVVNMAGGWTTWDDRVMSIVDESNRKLNDSEYLPKVDIGNNKVLVLENQEEIPQSVLNFIRTVLKQDLFSSVSRLNTDYNSEIGKWVGEAIKNGCDTIVAETQLINKTQLQAFSKLFTTLPAMTFHIFTISNLKEELYILIGVESTDQLFIRHNIIIHK